MDGSRKIKNTGAFKYQAIILYCNKLKSLYPDIYDVACT